MFKREVKPLSESMVDSIAKSINKLQYVEEKASRPADKADGDVKPQDISGEEPVKADGSAKKAPARKGDQAQADSMEKVKEETELEEAVNVKAIQKAVDDGKSMDVIVGMFANKRTTNTDEIRKVVKDYMWKKRMKKEEVEISESHYKEGDKVECIKSGMKGTVAKVDPDGKGAYYTVKREDGKMMQYAPDDLKAISEAMDPVNPVAVKKKFKDRKDKDIDNDGDTDSSDEYLHKRRKAISKALEERKTELKKDSDDPCWDSHVQLGTKMKNGKEVPNCVPKEEVELGEAKNYEIKNGKIHISKANFRKVHKDYKNATKGKERMMALDPKTGGTTSFPVVFTEAKSDYTIYHKTFSSAVQHAAEVAKKRGFEVDDDEWDRKVAMGPRKPGKGKTNSYSIGLMKNGKPVKQKLQMQVYYDEGRYELNMYIS